jgi:lipopolysaccharide biosynthesis glycosyltransferase
MIEHEQIKFPNSGLPSPDLTRDRGIEVLCACDERYLPHAATMLCSLLVHNSVSRIHFFYSSIPGAELVKLRSFVARYGTEIALYEIAPAELQGLRVDKWATLAVYYRLLAAQLLPADVDKVLYLDSDIIIRCSLQQLWNTDIVDYALAAVSNYDDEPRKALGLPEGTKYFNSGVLLINLQFWRENNVPDGAVSFIKNNPERVQYWDQDALNAILVHRWVELSSCWNWQDWQHKFIPGAGTEPAIVHFITADKPWQWSNKHPFKHEYRKYRLKTPWRQYRQEGRPGLPYRLGHSLRSVTRVVLPHGLRRWLRSRVMNSQA